MAIVCEPFESRHLNGVRRFNERLRAAGVEPAFLIGLDELSTLAPRSSPVSTERILAVDGDEVRGGYLVQWRDFLVAGEVRRLGNYQTPVSEGIVNKQFASVGLVLLKYALRASPYWYTVGMGGLERPLPRILKSLQWHLQLVPLWLRVHRASAFLREIRYLRSTAARRFALGTLRWTGAGWLGLQVLGGLAAARLPSIRIAAEPFVQFDQWADTFWDEVSAEFPFAAVRKAKVLNALYPPSDPRYRRLRITVDGRPAGWVVLLRQALQDNRYFGNMTAGVIADCLAAPADILAVLLAASRELDSMGVDFSFANPLHAACDDALRRIGYRTAPTNYGFGLSKPLAALLNPLDTCLRMSHLMRGDGDGLSNFGANH